MLKPQPLSNSFEMKKLLMDKRFKTSKLQMSNFLLSLLESEYEYSTEQLLDILILVFDSDSISESIYASLETLFIFDYCNIIFSQHSNVIPYLKKLIAELEQKC